MEPKRLYRSRENRVLCGVCGGIAEYFNVDPVFGSGLEWFCLSAPVLEPVFWHILLRQ